MILRLFPASRVDTAVHQLPEDGMVVDPRPISRKEFKFVISVNGTALSITRIDRKEGEVPGWDVTLIFRLYSRNEFHYSFESTKYLYHGLDGEKAPGDATEAIVKDGVESIRFYAFWGCFSLSKIIFPNSLTAIALGSFGRCLSLRSIQFPPNLQFIGVHAFDECSSLEAIYLPPTVTRIDQYAFRFCKSLRIMNIPDNLEFIHLNTVTGCDNLLTDDMKDAPDDELDQWLRNRYNPLHNLCWDPSVTAGDIQQYIQQQYIQEHNDDNDERARTNDKPQFTPLHLLAANPSVTGEMITAYLELAPDVAEIQDNIDQTPLHMLYAVPSFCDDIGGAIKAYLGSCNEGKKAAFMKDCEGRTPFECLCEKNFDELSFLQDKTFGGLMIWWYGHCLDMNLFAEDGDLEGSRKRKVSCVMSTEHDE